jgi:predicted peptidase
MGGGGTWAMATALPDKIAAIVPICGAAKPGPGDAAKLHGMPVWANHAFSDPTVHFPEHTQAWFDALLTDLGAAPQGGVMTGYQHTDKPWIGVLGRKGWQWQEGTVPPPAKEGAPTVLLTVYPDGSHDSWTRTYANPAVWSWLFAQSRAKRSKSAH